MKPLAALALLLAALAPCARPQDASNEPIRLEPGEYRWVPVNIRQTPTLVDCRYSVLDGSTSAHVELMPMREFRLYYRQREHETLAVTESGRAGAFKRMLDSPGRYAVVISNDTPQAASVSFEVRTEVDPNASVVAATLPPARRLAVILISFAVFFAAVFWSGWKLTRAARDDA